MPPVLLVLFLLLIFGFHRAIGAPLFIPLPLTSPPPARSYRAANAEVRVASLHALASAAGLQRAHEVEERSAALLSAGAEETLRSGVYRSSGAASGAVQR